VTIRKPKRPCRNVFWRHMTVNDPAGSSLAEWAYRTPRFANGIPSSVLKRADPAIQAETGFLWFVSNLKQYDLSGGKYFTFGVPGRGFGQAPFAPAPMSSKLVLDQEFGEVLPVEIRHNIGESLPGDWMWDEIDESLVPSEPPAADFDFAHAIITRLTLIEQALRLSAEVQAGIGHNRSPGERPLSEAEQEQALAALRQAKEAIAASSEMGNVEFKKAWNNFLPVLPRLGNWLLARSDDFGTEFAKAAGKSLGEKAPAILFRSTAIAIILHEAAQINDLAHYFISRL
jgi:hypothetical protein